MTLIKKNLKTVKNKLLCELEDFVFESIAPLMSNKENLSSEKQEELSAVLMNGVMDTIKLNSTRFTIICYTNGDGEELTEDDLVDIPLKLMIFKECLPDIMEILGDYISEGEEQSTEGKLPEKPKKLRKR